MKTHLNDLTPEDREQLRLKAEASRERKKEYALNNLNMKYADLSHWRALASKYNINLPVWYEAGTELKHVKRVFKKTGVDVQDYVKDMGCSTLKQISQCNPDATARAMVGWALEYIDGRELCRTHETQE